MVSLLIILAGVVMVLALTASCLHWLGQMLPAHTGRTDATIVVLGGGVRDGALTPLGYARVAAGVRAAGGEGPIFFTGGLADGRGEAAIMAPVAREMGVEAERIRQEGRSHSTLQNALFTYDALGGGPIILASDRFHLIRAAMLFRWAGFEVVGFAPSTYRGDSSLYMWQIVREALSLWINLTRMAFWRLGGLIGISRCNLIKWLT